MFKLSTVTGDTLVVQGQDEAAVYQTRRDKYLAEYAFTDAADLADLDRLLFLELMHYRWSKWLASGVDNENDRLSMTEGEQLRRNIKDLGPQISQVKNDLGMTRTAREKENYESVGQYISQLKTRAKQFGVMRERQLDEALTLLNELFGIISAVDRSNPLERAKIGFENDSDIVDWVRAVAEPRYKAIDTHFRNRPDGQRVWVGTI